MPNSTFAAMNRKTEILILGLLSAAFSAYVLIRAWILPITVDESATIINHVPRLVVDMVFYERDAVPNNHILNTLAIKTFAGIFGWHPFVMRLPVLIGAFVYLRASWALPGLVSTQAWVRLFLFIMLTGNPYLLEFFSLARGYGLAAGLMLAAIWQAGLFMEQNTRRHLRNAFLLAGLAVYGNFTLILFIVPFAAFLLVIAWQSNPSIPVFWKKAKPACMTLGIFIALWITPLLRMSRHSEVQGWNELPAFLGSVEQLVKASIHNNAYFGPDTARILAWLTVAFSTGTCIWAIARWWQQRRRFSADPRLVFILLLTGIALLNVLQVHLTKTPYLQSRLALFYYPLFALQTGIVATWLWERWQRRAWIFMAPLLLFITLNLGRCLNFRESTEWWVDQATYVVIDYLKKTCESENRTQPFTIDAHWVMLNSYVYHLERDPREFGRYAKLVPYHGNRPPQKEADFYYAIHAEEVRDIMDAYHIVLRIPQTSLILLRRN